MKRCNIYNVRPRIGGKGCNSRICKGCDRAWYRCAARGAQTPMGNHDSYPSLEWAAKRARMFARLEKRQ